MTDRESSRRAEGTASMDVATAPMDATTAPIDAAPELVEFPAGESKTTDPDVT